MGFQPILGRFYFQWELYRQRRRSVDSDAQVNRGSNRSLQARVVHTTGSLRHHVLLSVAPSVATNLIRSSMVPFKNTLELCVQSERIGIETLIMLLSEEKTEIYSLLSWSSQSYNTCFFHLHDK